VRAEVERAAERQVRVESMRASFRMAQVYTAAQQPKPLSRPGSLTSARSQA